MKKRLCLLICMLIPILSFSFISFAEELDKEMETQMENIAKEFVTQLTSMDLSESYKPEEENEQADLLFKSWYQIKKETGAFQSFNKEGTKVTQPEKGEYLVILNAKCEKSDVTFHVTLAVDATMGTVGPKSITVERILTLGQKMQDAVLNTIMGMGTVFVVLIFISFIISLFGYIPKLINSPKQDKQTVVTNIEKKETPALAETQTNTEQEELADDKQLAAVITAAIMASMGDNISEDGFVVRSIKKRGTKNWKNA